MNMDLFTSGQPDKGWKDEMCIATYYNGGSKGTKGKKSSSRKCHKKT